eukprot:symbB.v1.2.027400.t1/scaffold2808.1/size69842/2
MIQFEEHIFQMGWFNHQLENKRCKRLPVTLVKGNPILALPGCCPDALLTLPGIHQEHAGLVRHRLILGNYTGLNPRKLWSSELPGATRHRSRPRFGTGSPLAWRHVIVVRVPKASSSTLASVFVRIGRSLGHLIPVGDDPARFRPRRGKSQRVHTRVMLTTRHETPSEAWTSWMETMSWPKPLEKMSILRSKCDASNFSWDYLCCGDFQYHFLALPAESTEDLLARFDTWQMSNERMRKVMGHSMSCWCWSSKDFIFITERFADSLLVFRSLWNLTFSQLLHVRAIVKTEPGFLENNQRDLVLWHHANARLDALLEAYGTKEQLTQDREMLDAVLTVARDSCQRFSMEVCIDCLHEDIGCAQDCLDRVAEHTRVFVGDT